MHFHIPKPLHGWRAFIGEVGIIVLGVLIALGAEQIVEGFHERYVARQAEDRIRTELAFNSAFAAQRVAVGDCMRASFRDLQQRLIASRHIWHGLDNVALRGAPTASELSPLFATRPSLGAPHGVWPVSAWTAATASGGVSNARHRFFRYAALYAMVGTLSRLQDQEVADYSRLMPLEVQQTLDPSARLQLFRDLDRARGRCVGYCRPEERYTARPGMARRWTSRPDAQPRFLCETRSTSRRGDHQRIQLGLSTAQQCHEE